jgi:hypothetical protein
MDIDMDISLHLKNSDGNIINKDIDRIKFHKMVFIFNALDEGWTIKKRHDSYYFIKNHEGKKEIFTDKYLSTFMKENLDINKILSSNDR